MKKLLFGILGIILVIAALIGTVQLSAASEILAFPGAEGFGRYAVGGRGGEIYHVTNLNDSGSGSLRDAISQPNRIIVFDVGGVIRIKSRLVFKNNQTIAGQTAPGGGITIYGDGTSFSSASNTIVRYVRFRMGKIGTSDKDTVTMANGHDVIWDHCSLSWGRDANFDLNRSSGKELYNLTLQDSIVSQGLQTHSTGGIANTTGTSIIRSLYIDNNSRNPKARGTLQFVNNIIYNWVSSGYILGDTSGRSDGAMIGNYLISGPETNGGTLSSPTSAYNIYAIGNYYDSNKDGTLNGRLLSKGDFGSATWWESPSVEFPNVPAMTAQEALNYVVDNAGTSLWRDDVDKYVVNELLSFGKKGATISNEENLGISNIVGNIPNGSAPNDSDKDGMPDSWESEKGLDPNNYDDCKLDRNNDGYTNIEEYINQLVSGQSNNTPTIENTITNTQVVTLSETPVNTTPTTNTSDEIYSISYTIQNDWGSGGSINIVVTNNSSSTINTWTLEWSFPGNQQISSYWNCDIIQKNATVSASNIEWNGTISSGANVSFGFNINYTGSNNIPTNFTLNGISCTIE
ncbi:MAG: cellulose binding domain-containing protein [Clostridiales bacterium]